MVIYIFCKYIKHHSPILLILFFCRQIQFSAHNKQIFVSISQGTHGSQSLGIYFSALHPIKALGKEILCSFNLYQTRRHHVDTGILGHQIISHLYPSKRKFIFPACIKLQYIVLKVRRQIGLARTNNTCSLIHTDNSFRALTASGSSHLVQIFHNKTVAHINVHILPVQK